MSHLFLPGTTINLSLLQASNVTMCPAHRLAFSNKTLEEAEGELSPSTQGPRPHPGAAAPAQGGPPTGMVNLRQRLGSHLPGPRRKCLESLAGGLSRPSPSLASGSPCGPQPQASTAYPELKALGCRSMRFRAGPSRLGPLLVVLAALAARGDDEHPCSSADPAVLRPGRSGTAVALGGLLTHWRPVCTVPTGRVER